MFLYKQWTHTHTHVYTILQVDTLLEKQNYRLLNYYATVHNFPLYKI